MRVVYLADDFPPASFGGAGISTFELAKAVHEAGHDVSVITTCREAGQAGETLYEGLRVCTLQSSYPERWRAWRGVYNPRVLRELDRLLAKLRPDVVHANNIHYHLSWASLKVAKRHARVVWTARDAMAVSFGKLETARYLERLDPRVSWLDNLRQAKKRYNPLRNLLIRHYLRYADQKCAVSKALAELLRSNGIKGVEVVHTGIDVRAWEVSPGAVAAFKSTHGLSGKPVILFGGRLNALAQVAAAMRLVAEAAPQATLLVMGREERAAAVKQVSAGLNTVFTGWLEGAEKITAYAASDVVWVPSAYFDAFPRTVLEAMAAGKPVVATRYGGAKEAVEEGVTGYAIDPRRPEELAEKTRALVLDPAKAAALGQAGRRRVEERFSLRQYAARYLEIYGA